MWNEVQQARKKFLRPYYSLSLLVSLESLLLEAVDGSYWKQSSEQWMEAIGSSPRSSGWKLLEAVLEPNLT